MSLYQVNINKLELHKEVQDEILKREFDEYKRNIQLKNECSSCQFIFGAICLSVTTYLIIKSRFSWSSFSRIEKFGHISAILFTTGIVFYKFSYGIHIRETKNWMEVQEMKKLK